MAKLNVDQQRYEFPWSPSWEQKRLKEILREVLPELSSRATVLVAANGLVRQDDEVIDDLDAMARPQVPLTVDLRHGLRGEQKPRKPKLSQQIRVLYDDPHMVVVSKSAGIIVQPSPEEVAGVGPPVIELLKHYWKAKGEPLVNPILVQRLDKETSGLMVLGKTAPAAKFLQRQAGGRYMERRYLAVVEGVVAGQKGTWKNVIGVGENGFRQVVGPYPVTAEEKLPTGVQTAITEWHVVERFAGHTLLELKLETGRTHQVRIHCAEAGHPVVGDAVYVKLARIKHPRNRYGKTKAPRMMLHAAKLKFQHSEKETRWLTFRDEMPDAMKGFLETIRLVNGVQQGNPQESTRLEK